MAATRAASSKSRPRVRGLIVTVVGLGVVCALLVRTLAGHGADFVDALHTAPGATLAAAVVLQTIALVARSEAWLVCVTAAGGLVKRRRLYRAASMGYVGTLINGQFGVAARIAALRHSAPRDSPPVGALITAELPILAVEAGLAALTSFTLVGPLGLPWWAPFPALAAIGLISLGLGRLARGHRRSLWRGLRVMRSAAGQLRVTGLVLIAVFSQIARNWLVLHALGVDASVFDAIAVLIAMVTLSQLPVGPSVGAAATVAILGPDGPATAAAAGVLLTATGTAGALCYAGWAVGDRVLGPRLAALRSARASRSLRTRSLSIGHAGRVLAGLPTGQRRNIEAAYFGGLSVPEIMRLFWPPHPAAASGAAGAAL